MTKQMSATAKQQDAATQELWRVAESGDVDELVHVFVNGAHVNARNQHGTTALMRAASQGHARMVRALLERGADPNLARNDKFTALALAAFFGHTETVRILVEHGAKTDAITRCGASAQTWAIRRTFADAARCLESGAATRAPRVAVPAPVAPVAPVVKTLKDPPEIWDLVHEVPRNFTARSAFVSRLQSMKTSFALRVAAVVVVSSACVVGVLVLRGSQARSLAVETPAQPSVAATEVSAPVNVENTKSEAPVEASTDAVNQLSHHSEPATGTDKRSRKLMWTRQIRSRATSEEEPVQIVESTEAPAATPEVAKPKVEPPRQSDKANTGLSPQLVSPAKSTAPKAKVIPWP